MTGLCKIKAIREELFRLVDEARLERGRAQSNADKTAAATEAANSTETDMSGSCSSHSSEVVVVDSADKVHKQQLAERLRSFNARDDDTLSLPFSRSNSLSSHEGEVVAGVVRDLEAAKAEEDMVIPKRKTVTRKKDKTNNKTASVSRGGPVLMELEDDLVQSARVVAEDDELLDSSDERGEKATRISTIGKRRRLQKGGMGGEQRKRVSEVSNWREDEDEEEEDFLKPHKKGVRKRMVRSVVLDSDCSDSEGVSTSGEEESDFYSEEVEEEEEFEVVSVPKKSVNRSKAATAKAPLKSAFAEMTAASKVVGSGSAIKPKRGKKIAASPVGAVAPSIYSGLGQKIIVFVHHKDVMDAVEEALRELNVQYVRIDGAVTGPNRNKLISKFQKDDVVSWSTYRFPQYYNSFNIRRMWRC